LTIILILLNLAISTFNSWSVGRGWAESRHVGGWARFMAWCGAIMAASGFTWSFTMLLAFGAEAMGKLPPAYVEGMTRLGYLVVILPIIGSGLAITVQSWAYFWRRRSFANGAVAGWNSFAQVYNIVSAMDAVPESLSFLADLFGGKSKGSSDKDSAALRLMIMLVVLAVVGGILVTAVIIRTTARRHATNVSWGVETLLNEQRTRERMAARSRRRY
jgi:heme/copper-type cytochrome/quinol oxidase subunit 2